MHTIYIDESGYTPDWEAGISQQPFYALAGVLIPADNLHAAYDGLRKQVGALGLPVAPSALGQGFEIKAKEIANGSGWWKGHTAERNAVRDLMLSFPRASGGAAILIVVDKAAHQAKYYTPETPYLMSLKYLLERASQYLWEQKDYGICIYDQNTRLEAELSSAATGLMRSGSALSYFSEALGVPVVAKVSIEKLLEFTLGNSANSLGLQVADYFATFAYQYYKAGLPSPCGWWDTLRANLRSHNGVVEGFGLKVCPGTAA